MSLLKGVCSQFWGALCSGDSFSPECPVKYFSNFSAVQKRTLSIFTSLFLSIGNLRVLKYVSSTCSCGLAEALKSGPLQPAFSLHLPGLAQLHVIAVSGLILPQCAGHALGTGVLVGRDRKGHLPKMCCLHSPSSSLEEGSGLGRSLPWLAQSSWAACSLWESLSHHPA